MNWKINTAALSLIVPFVASAQVLAESQPGYIGVRLDKNVVHSVLPNSPAEAGRLLPGDAIVAIDGADATKLSDKEILARLSGVTGGAVNLTILRDGKKYSSKIIRAYAVEKPGEEASFARPEATAKIAQPQARAVTTNASNTSVTDQALVKVFRHTAETDTIKAQVLSAVAHIPQNIKDRFASAGLTILIVPTVLEARPDLAGQKPRGYDNGGGYDNCGGMYMPSEKTIFVAERYGIQNQPYMPSRHSYETTLHESGHALDHLSYDTTRIDMSKSDDFASVYRSESDSLTNSQRNHVTYFLQSEGAGGAELFAELFKAICDPQAKDDYHVVKTFPRTYSYLQRAIQQL